MSKLRITLATLLLIALNTSCQQCDKDEDEDVKLLPGEKVDLRYPKPVIESVVDLKCAVDTNCPSKASDCVTKTFTVQKDTLYYLTVSYFNGDTLTPSCRSCGTVYLGDSVVMSKETACPTGGPWIDHAQLQQGKTYTLSICMHHCPDVPPCNCGKHAISDAAVSIQRLY